MALYGCYTGAPSLRLLQGGGGRLHDDGERAGSKNPHPCKRRKDGAPALLSRTQSLSSHIIDTFLYPPSLPCGWALQKASILSSHTDSSACGVCTSDAVNRNA